MNRSRYLLVLMGLVLVCGAGCEQSRTARLAEEYRTSQSRETLSEVIKLDVQKGDSRRKVEQLLGSGVAPFVGNATSARMYPARADGHTTYFVVYYKNDKVDETEWVSE